MLLPTITHEGGISFLLLYIFEDLHFSFLSSFTFHHFFYVCLLKNIDKWFWLDYYYFFWLLSRKENIKKLFSTIILLWLITIWTFIKKKVSMDIIKLKMSHNIFFLFLSLKIANLLNFELNLQWKSFITKSRRKKTFEFKNLI